MGVWLHLIASIIVFNVTAFLIPKTLSNSENYVTSLFSLLLVLVTDVTLNLKYDLYGYFNEGVDGGGFIAIYGIYPAINILFLNLFPYEKGLIGRSLYFLSWWFFAVIYEYYAVKVGWFYYHGWRLEYSIFVYPLLYLLLLWSLQVARSLNRNTIKG
ncbi:MULTISPECIES: CBO0543 family protein [Paenibacillus]|uniref:CBO0543 family protein n=1 Tax=Paenibacillus TaxID=44249 RepID=UPI0022B88181|nr:CBO0543 family protein [Paenibacillus caseinilyticus]MCZ8518372.1 hypothetical protein [Paenibacillus caseinilyticus]